MVGFVTTGCIFAEGEDLEKQECVLQHQCVQNVKADNATHLKKIFKR